MPYRPTVRVLYVALLLALGGCSPADFVNGMDWTVHQTHVDNAAFQRIGRRVPLYANAFLLDRLDRAGTVDDLAEARNLMRQTLAQSYQLTRYVLNNEMDRLPERSWAQLWQRYYTHEPPPDDVQKELRDRFWKQVHHRYTRLHADMASAPSVERLHALAASLRSSARPSPKDRHGGGPLLATVAAAIKEETGPLDRGGPFVDLYQINGELTCENTSRSAVGSREDQLLLKYAPLIVQERNPNAAYHSEVDRIGTVRLLRGFTGYHVVIDTARPSVYAYWQHTWVNGQKHLQLTYTQWFPQHPKSKLFDTEAGAVEGTTLRITLDSQGRPAILETVYNCGCYHRCYPARRIEKSSCDEQGGPLPGKRFCIEREVAGKADWILPETVDVLGGDAVRPILFSRAGYHGLVGISFSHEDLVNRVVDDRRTYTLRCYDDLERLRVGNRLASLFGSNGLVHGAGRLEGLLLTPTGMLSAGQPRQRGTQLLHWDQYDFDDPHLFEECLRLPRRF